MTRTRQAVTLLAAVEGLQRLGKVPARVQGEDVDVGGRPGYGMKDGLVLQPKAGGKRNRAQPGSRDLDDPGLEAVERGEAPAQGGSGAFLKVPMFRPIDRLRHALFIHPRVSADRR